MVSDFHACKVVDAIIFCPSLGLKLVCQLTARINSYDVQCIVYSKGRNATWNVWNDLVSFKICTTSLGQKFTSYF